MPSAPIPNSPRPVYVIKIGGNSLAADPAFLPSIAGQCAALQRLGASIVLMHGGGPQIDAALATQGIATRRAADGRRITDAATMAAMIPVMEDLRTTIVAALSQAGCRVTAPAIPPLIGQTLRDPEDCTGAPRDFDAAALRPSLEQGDLIVLHCIGRSKDGIRHYNINADDAALAAAVALQAQRLILATNVAGVWDHNRQPIPRITPDKARALIAAGVISGGMIPKIESALAAMQSGIGAIAIVDGHAPDALHRALHQPDGIGTLLIEDAETEK